MMKTMKPWMARLGAIALGFGLMLSALPASAYTQDQTTELKIGQQEYQTLAQQGKIVTQSPYYATLNPIGSRIAAVANTKYFTPFHFILVNDTSPNAFAVPGGNLYVTTAMMRFAQNKEELAGVLCHETSHDINHDVMHLQSKYQTIGIVGGLLSMIIGNSAIGQTLLNVGANAEAGRFSRPVESAADHMGAYTCAQAGFNPWGMVWMMQRFQSASGGAMPEFLSDHPTDAHRIAALESTFRSNPATFGRFSSNPASAHPLY
jgi:predicted Zn-dependent protease